MFSRGGAPYTYETVYEKEKITIKLFANGVDTGRSIELSLKNNWSASFKGLAYEDSNGNVIKYSIKEIIDNGKWVITYGDVVASGGNNPTYSTTVTNTYRTGGPILPATGSYGRLLFILCGLGIMLGTLIYGIIYRCRRKKELG